MSTFQVDTLAIQHGAKRVKQLMTSLADIVPQFTAQGAHAPSTGDANCAAAYHAFVDQWGSELINSAGVVLVLLADLVLAANDYVATECAIANLPVYTFSLDDL